MEPSRRADEIPERYRTFYAALEKLCAVALAEAKKPGAAYSDFRIGRFRIQFSGYRLSAQRGGNITDEVPFVTDRNSFGFGVRVIVNGQ
ncbi:MAG: hypothetical protein M3Y07_17630 [Acidobacteriota bacterium]|nr:hypothetical protein [Acidobacteriota bacterium]